MWTRWRTTRPAIGRMSTASGAALRRPAHLQERSFDASRLALHGRMLSTTNGSVHATQSHDNDDDAQTRARRCVGDFSRTIRSARTARQLTTLWSLLSKREPVVVVEGGFVRPVGSLVEPTDETSARVTIPEDSFAVRMVSLAEMLSLVQQGKRTTVMDGSPSVKTLSQSEAEVSAIRTFDVVLPGDHVLPVSEAFVARKMLGAFSRLGAHAELTQFLETYEPESRRVRSMQSSGDDKQLIAELSALGDHANALYITSLGHVKEHAKVLARFQQHSGGDLGRIIASRDAFRSLLTACTVERNGPLARRIVDHALDRATLATFHTTAFTSAIHACLRGEARSQEGLQHAMHLYRRMVHELGYVAPPYEWTLLFNSCVYLDQPEMAIEVFADYDVHGIVPFQRRFQLAIRMACRHAQYDTAVAMARTWIRVEVAKQQSHEASQASQEEEDDRRRRRRADEAECLNKILWEMLKQNPLRKHIEEVLLAMQSRGFYAGALVIRRAVTHFFLTASSDDQLAPEAVVYRFFDLWERVPDTIQRTSFVLHLVLEECESRGWSDQCERVIEYALENDITLPLDSTAKLMDGYASRGEFDNAIQLGELALQPQLERVLAEAAANTTKKSKHNRNKQVDKPASNIPDAFLESLLRCYLFRERFEDVVRVDEAFQLSARRRDSNSVALAAILREARDMSRY